MPDQTNQKQSKYFDEILAWCLETQKHVSDKTIYIKTYASESIHDRVAEAARGDIRAFSHETGIELKIENIVKKYPFVLSETAIFNIPNDAPDSVKANLVRRNSQQIEDTKEKNIAKVNEYIKEFTDVLSHIGVAFRREFEEVDSVLGRKIRQSLARIWPEPRKCFICASIEWIVSDQLYCWNSYEDENVVIGGSTIPFVAATCKRCGNTVTFNAITLGLFPTEMGDQNAK